MNDPPPLFVQNSRGAGKGKVHSFGKRDHAIKRNLNVPVVVRGWLYKQVSRASSAASGPESKSCLSKLLPPPYLQDSSGMRLWKRKWFVLSDYCLFYYKGESRSFTVVNSAGV